MAYRNTDTGGPALREVEHGVQERRHSGGPALREVVEHGAQECRHPGGPALREAAEHGAQQYKHPNRPATTEAKLEAEKCGLREHKIMHQHKKISSQKAKRSMTRTNFTIRKRISTEVQTTSPPTKMGLAPTATEPREKQY